MILSSNQLFSVSMTAVADSSSPWNQVDNADPFEAGFTSLKAHNIDKHA